MPLPSGREDKLDLDEQCYASGLTVNEARILLLHLGFSCARVDTDKDCAL